MKKILTILLFMPQIINAKSTVSENINTLFEPIVEVLGKVIFWEPFLGVPIVVIWLVVGALYFTIRMNFISIRGFKQCP